MLTHRSSLIWLRSGIRISESGVSDSYASLVRVTKTCHLQQVLIFVSLNIIYMSLNPCIDMINQSLFGGHALWDVESLIVHQVGINRRWFAYKWHIETSYINIHICVLNHIDNHTILNCIISHYNATHISMYSNYNITHCLNYFS